MKKFARIDGRYYEIVDETEEDVWLLIPFDYDDEDSEAITAWYQKTQVD